MQNVHTLKELEQRIKAYQNLLALILYKTTAAEGNWPAVRSWNSLYFIRNENSSLFSSHIMDPFLLFIETEIEFN